MISQFLTADSTSCLSIIRKSTTDSSHLFASYHKLKSWNLVLLQNSQLGSMNILDDVKFEKTDQEFHSREITADELCIAFFR